MKKVEKMALDKAINTLEALGVSYRLVLNNGTVRTNMAEEKKKAHVDFTPIYKDAVTNIKVGEVAVIEVPENIEVERIRSIVAAQMRDRYGVGAHMSTVDGQKIELLRLA